MPKITCMHSNKKNGITLGSSRITVYFDNGDIVDRFEVPAWRGVEYCQRYTGGRYAARLRGAITKAGGF